MLSQCRRVRPSGAVARPDAPLMRRAASGRSRPGRRRRRASGRRRGDDRARGCSDRLRDGDLRVRGERSQPRRRRCRRPRRPTGRSAVSTSCARRTVVDPGLHRRIQRLSTMPAAAIDAHCSSTEWARTSRSRSAPDRSRTWSIEQRLGLEAERAEHRDQRLLVGDHLDDQLRQPELERLEHGVARERPPDAAAALVGVDDDAHLADVARPAVQRDDRDVADDLAVRRARSSARRRAHPGGDDVRVGRRPP